jgi:hypothetical protein
MTSEDQRQPQNHTSVTREIRVVTDTGPNAALLDTARFEHAQRIAASIAHSPLIPEHLRRNKHREFEAHEILANVMLVTSQALLWDVHPFTIIGETYVVGGRLAYQGKLIAAIINSKAKLQHRLRYSFIGKKGTPEFTVKISGTFVGENDPSELELSVAEARTENQMWVKDPEQKLIYSGVVRWARRFCPEIILGIITEDDGERMETWSKEASAAPAPKSGPIRTEKPIFSKPAEKPVKKAKQSEPEPTPPPTTETPSDEFPWNPQDSN